MTSSLTGLDSTKQVNMLLILSSTEQLNLNQSNGGKLYSYMYLISPCEVVECSLLSYFRFVELDSRRA